MMQTCRRASTGAAVLFFLFAPACGAPGRPEGTIVYASGTDLESANPLVTIHTASRQVQRYALFVTLARYDTLLEPVPYAARSWEWSPDRTVLRFVLVAGLRWHDGIATTARDVAFTLDAARDPQTGYPRYSDLADVVSVQPESDSVVSLTFNRPQPRFPLVLCELPIVPAHLLATVPRNAMRQAGFTTAPVGNGPFRFTERRANQRWVFERNPDFPESLGGPPRAKRFVIAVVDEATTKFAGLVGGELDVAGIAPGMAKLVREDPSLRVLDYPVLFSTGLVFNTTQPPLDDFRVRNAISLSLNRERIIGAALAGYATAASGPVPPGHPYSASSKHMRDTVLADSLLEAAGWSRRSDGRRAKKDTSFEIELLTVGSGDNAAEQLIQGDLAARGIRVEIRQRELASFLAEARASSKTFDVLYTGIPGDLSLAYIAAMYHTRLAGGALDYAGYHTPVLDSLLDRARTAESEVQVRVAWLAVQLELAKQVPTAWIFHARGLQGVARRLQGVTMDLRGEMATLSDWFIAPDPVVASTKR
ncbi:MAG: peptide ABC transporter substrate-binding protein [Anaerolineae bacterium]|nr:peptide ABC transporter substrate-binding protein [Gemmatimonadaceae bacterium]